MEKIRKINNNQSNFCKAKSYYLSSNVFCLWSDLLSKKGGEKYEIIMDHSGSVRYIVRTSDGAIVQEIEYDSFGNIIEDTNPAFTPFAFAGGIYDKDTGLIRFGARDYDPEIGRWLSKDRFDFLLGSFNLYSYVLNDPINYFDPFGLKECLSDFEWAILKNAEIVAAVGAIKSGSAIALAGAGLIVTGVASGETGLGLAAIFGGMHVIGGGFTIIGLGARLTIDILGFNKTFGLKPLLPPRCKDLEKEKSEKEKYSRSYKCRLY